MVTQCVAFVLHVIFLRKKKFNIILYLENIYNIKFIKYLIFNSEQFCYNNLTVLVFKSLVWVIIIVRIREQN